MSVAIRGILCAQEPSTLATFFAQLLAKSRVQFILHDVDDLNILTSLVDQSIIQTTSLEVLHVLGRYSKDQESTPDQLDPFLEARDARPRDLGPMREMICVFGQGQITCLLLADQKAWIFALVFKMEFGFLTAPSHDNAELVRALVSLLPG